MTTHPVFRDGLLDGQVALITGGGSGIGRGIADVLASLGAHVVLASRKLERVEAAATEIRAAGGRASGIAVDVREPERVQQMMADVPRFVSTPEIRVECADEIKFDIVAKATRHFAATHNVIDVDGVRVLFGDGWGLIRASNTQPVLVMRFEARTEDHLNAIRSEMEGWLAQQGVKL